MPKTYSYSLFIIELVLSTNFSLFSIIIANELSEFRNYLTFKLKKAGRFSPASLNNHSLVIIIIEVVLVLFIDMMVQTNCLSLRV